MCAYVIFDTSTNTTYAERKCEHREMACTIVHSMTMVILTKDLHIKVRLRPIKIYNPKICNSEKCRHIAQM